MWYDMRDELEMAGLGRIGLDIGLSLAVQKSINQFSPKRALMGSRQILYSSNVTN
jgi:hypothetical protein